MVSFQDQEPLFPQGKTWKIWIVEEDLVKLGANEACNGLSEGECFACWISRTAGSWEVLFLAGMGVGSLGSGLKQSFWNCG